MKELLIPRVKKVSFVINNQSRLRKFSFISLNLNVLFFNELLGRDCWSLISCHTCSCVLPQPTQSSMSWEIEYYCYCQILLIATQFEDNNIRIYHNHTIHTRQTHHVKVEVKCLLNQILRETFKFLTTFILIDY